MDTAIAYSHSLFNIVNAVLFAPFIGLLADFVTRIYKGKGDFSDRVLVYISDRVSSPAVALDLAMREC